MILDLNDIELIEIGEAPKELYSVLVEEFDEEDAVCLHFLANSEDEIYDWYKEKEGVNLSIIHLGTLE